MLAQRVRFAALKRKTKEKSILQKFLGTTQKVLDTTSLKITQPFKSPFFFFTHWRYNTICKSPKFTNFFDLLQEFLFCWGNSIFINI